MTLTAGTFSPDYYEVERVLGNVKIMLLDIEGTTTSISFVQNELFQFVKVLLESFIKEHWDEEEIQQIVHSFVNNQAKLKDEDGFIYVPAIPSELQDKELLTYDKEFFYNKLIDHIKWQQARNFKTPELKALQGLILKAGYENYEIKGHLYDDVPDVLKFWRQKGKKVYMYSSASVIAQKLLFKYSKYGDLSSYIDGYFDYTVGDKLDPDSYAEILKILGATGDDILFFTDRPKEVSAAYSNGIRSVRMERLNEPNPYLAADQANIEVNLELEVMNSFVSLMYLMLGG